MCLRTRHRLGKREQQGQVAAYVFFFKLSGSLNALPGRGKFDVDAWTWYIKLFVQLDDKFGFLDHLLFVKRQFGVYLCTHTTRHDFQYLQTKTDG